MTTVCSIEFTETTIKQLRVPIKGLIDGWSYSLSFVEDLLKSYPVGQIPGKIVGSSWELRSAQIEEQEMQKMVGCPACMVQGHVLEGSLKIICFHCNGSGSVFANDADETCSPTPKLSLRQCKPHILYISGPMKGIEEHNYPAFFKMSKKLAGLGIDHYCPADNDSSRPRAELITKDIMAIMKQGVTGIVLLPGWQFSDGARLEVLCAKELKLAFFNDELQLVSPQIDMVVSTPSLLPLT